VTNASYIPDCKTWSKADRVTNGIYFSGNMTTYIQLLGSLRKGMVCKIVAELKQVKSSRLIADLLCLCSRLTIVDQHF
jgi:hypothetical protein